MIDQINESLVAALESGKIGQPVSLRVHCQISSVEITPGQLAGVFAPLVESVFSGSPDSVTTSGENPQRQITVLYKYQSGQTAMLTFGAGQSKHQAFHLLLAGNHGVLRLEGAENLPGLEDLSAGNEGGMTDLIEKSLSQSTTISL